MADPLDLFNAIYGQESGFGANPRTSVTGAVGGMQIQPSTWAQYAKPGEDINDKEDNIVVGKRILADLARRSGGDPARIAVGYFSGPGNIAPPGSPTPWIRDSHDPNGKYVSSYVSDIMRRLPSRPVTPTPGSTLNSMPPGPIDPSIIARGGVSPAIPSAVPAVPAPAPQPTIGQQIMAGDWGGALRQATARPPPKPGEEAAKSPIEKLASSLGGGQQQQEPLPAAPQMPPLAPMQDQAAAMAPAAQQLLTQIIAGQKPLSWSRRPYGYEAGPQLAQTPGTTLNSNYLQDYYG